MSSVPARSNLEIHVRSSAELSAQTRDEILALCDRAYGEDLRPAFDAFVEPVHVLAIVEGTIVSHALWVTRWLVPRGSAPLRTAYAVPHSERLTSKRWQPIPCTYAEASPRQ